MNDIPRTAGDFEARVSGLQGVPLPEKKLEVPEQILNWVNPAGDWKLSSFHWYKGVKLYLEGKRDEVEANEKIQVGQRLHGPGEGFVEGR